MRQRKSVRRRDLRRAGPHALVVSPYVVKGLRRFSLVTRYAFATLRLREITRENASLRLGGALE